RQDHWKYKSPTSQQNWQSMSETWTDSSRLVLPFSPNAAGRSFLFPAGSSIGIESAANHPRSEHRLDHPPQSRHSSPQPSPPLIPESIPPLLATSPSHRPFRTYIRTASALLPSAPHLLHTASASHPYPGP